jgi:hypothetical protein
VILTQINTLVASIEDAAESAETDIQARKSSPEFRIPVENRIETIPFIDRYFHGERETPPLQQVQTVNDVPVFVPLRPFWAVVSYAGSLMGYIALQLALDFSPAVLGLLFALLAPFPTHRTRLGRAWDNFWARRLEKWTPDAEEEKPVAAPIHRPVAPAPVAEPAEPVQQADATPAETAGPEPRQDEDIEPVTERPLRDDAGAEPKASGRLEPKFEDDAPDQHDPIRDDRPGDVRPY